MTNPIQVLSRDVHGAKRWKRSASYHFAARSNAVGLLADELPRAAQVMPLAFMRRGDVYVPSAVLGLAPGENLFLDADHKWVGRYIPASLRAYPFMLGKTGPEDEKRVLCVVEGNDAIVDGSEGELIFDEAGQPSAEIRKMLDLLLQMERSRAKTERAVSALADANLITPWKLALKSGDQTQALDGLYKIDEKQLNELSDEAFLKLRIAGALPLAYLMLFSEQHLPALVDLASRRRRVSAQKPTQH